MFSWKILLKVLLQRGHLRGAELPGGWGVTRGNRAAGEGFSVTGDGI